MLTKNILYLTPTGESQYFNSFAEELKKYSNNLHVLDVARCFSINGPRNTEQHIRDLITDKKIDIVISSPFATDYELSVEFYATLRSVTKLVFWMFDDEMGFDSHSKHYSQVADAVVTNDRFSVSGYEKLGVPSLHFMVCFSKQSYFPVKIEKNIDVCFLGNCKKADRMKYLDFLTKNGISVETFGVGSKNGPVALSELSGIFSRSKINLDFTKPELTWPSTDEPLINRMRIAKGRWAEIALTRSFCLTEYAPSTNTWFEIGKEIDVFHDQVELLEKVRFYLSADDKREEIANNAYARAGRSYETQIGIPKILEQLEALLLKTDARTADAGKIYLSRNFRINSIAGLTFSMFVLLKNRKIFHALELFIQLFKYGIFIFFTGVFKGSIRVAKTATLRLFCGAV